MKKITAKFVKESVEWLKAEKMGCVHFNLCDTSTKYMHICIGWHDNGDEWVIAWKIGMEGFNNAMQCDFDIDFLMPYNAESGEVYDTLHEIEGDNADYIAIADEMNEEAKGAVAFQIEEEKRIGEWDEENAA